MASRRMDYINSEKPWRAQIHINGRTIHIGYYRSKYEAQRAEDMYRRGLSQEASQLDAPTSTAG